MDNPLIVMYHEPASFQLSVDLKGSIVLRLAATASSHGGRVRDLSCSRDRRMRGRNVCCEIVNVR